MFPPARPHNQKVLHYNCDHQTFKIVKLCNGRLRCTIAEKILQTFHLFSRRDRTRISQFIEHNSSEYFFPITFIRNRASLAWRRIDFWGSVYVKPSASILVFSTEVRERGDIGLVIKKKSFSHYQHLLNAFIPVWFTFCFLMIFVQEHAQNHKRNILKLFL